MKNLTGTAILHAVVISLLSFPLFAQDVEQRLLIRNATVIDGTGAPARGPVDIVVEGGVITNIVNADLIATGRVGGRPEVEEGTRVIEAEGMYALPGLIDMHTHIPGENSPWGPDYAYKLFLAHGITTVRDAGSFSGFETLKRHREESEEGSRIAPRIFAYRAMFAGSLTPDSARELVRQYREEGADGIKLSGVYPDLLEAIGDEAQRVGLPIMQHNSIPLRGGANALLSSKAGVTSIEHWYGVPDVAVPGGADLPLDYNELNELHRFRWAGRLWQQVDWPLMEAALDQMIADGVSWNPTFSVYEGNRDLLRARNLPWLRDYAHPDTTVNWEPDPTVHGSFQSEWTTVDEVAWRQHFQLWMRAVRYFARNGGMVTAGADAGAGFHLFGFGFIRELEMHVEAGFSPLETLRHATANSAEILGEEKLGKLRPGWTADLILVEGNPIADLKRLYGAYGPAGAGVRWTIKDGRVYDAPALLREVREQVEGFN